ncbi:hypothetical protein RRG08_012430 [Elysia crispata]|uniref:Uncharacterized protein n=1 Tax=Elysia crispata TaxID=231223 RepID=A0AAE1AEL5_9GAST|nr:hypothetical protein RRG08_012430 [Elysia crispata]
MDCAKSSQYDAAKLRNARQCSLDRILTSVTVDQPALFPRHLDGTRYPLFNKEKVCTSNNQHIQIASRLARWRVLGRVCRLLVAWPKSTS